MKARTSAAIGWTLAVAGWGLAAWAGLKEPPSAPPQEGFVHLLKRELIPDETTALAVALAIFQGYFDEREIAKGRPYKAVRRGDEWSVFWDQGEPYFIRGGGTPELTLKAKDGRVLGIALSK